MPTLPFPEDDPMGGRERVAKDAREREPVSEGKGGGGVVVRVGVRGPSETVSRGLMRVLHQPLNM